jgi:hypothetical protein
MNLHFLDVRSERVNFFNFLRLTCNDEKGLPAVPFNVIRTGRFIVGSRLLSTGASAGLRWRAEELIVLDSHQPSPRVHHILAPFPEAGLALLGLPHLQIKEIAAQRVQLVQRAHQSPVALVNGRQKRINVVHQTYTLRVAEKENIQ